MGKADKILTNLKEELTEKEKSTCEHICNVINGEEYVKSNYSNPLVPLGYEYIRGNWKNGFTIARKSDGSEFTWIPVAALNANGNLIEKNFYEMFGRRNYDMDLFDEDNFSEPLEDEVIEQIHSVIKYGGFYLSTYEVSCDYNGGVQSKAYYEPITNVTWEEACILANEFENKNTFISSHIPYGSEYDSMVEWLIEFSGENTNKFLENSTTWGNFSGKVITTAYEEKYYMNGLYDIAGNLEEMTQEYFNNGTMRTSRGGSCIDTSEPETSIFFRKGFDVNEKSSYRGFRIALTIK